MLIFVTKQTERVTYTFSLVFGKLFGIDFKITSDENEFKNFSGAKLNYSAKNFGDALYLHAENILFEKNIREQDLKISTHDGLTVLFSNGTLQECQEEKSILPYDIFAAVFFMVSRYEEYLPFVPDAFGRFPLKESVAFKNNFWNQAIVHRWAAQLKNKISEKFVELKFPEPKYNFLLTYDIDIAFAYRERPIWRNAGAAVKEIFSGRFSSFKIRMSVLRGKMKDPFDTTEEQMNWQKKFSLTQKYFFLLSDWGKNNKNIHWQNKNLKQLIQKISSKFEVGIHPGFFSATNENIMCEEVSRLEKITNKKIAQSRQHFLKIKFPDTYEHLIANGIEEDYTMGYSEDVGFRCGMAVDFPWFNLKKNEATSLMLIPFQVMDASLFYSQKLKAEEALTESKKIIDEVKSVGGQFVFLAHNDLIGDESEWKNWKNNFEKILDYASS